MHRTDSRSRTMILCTNSESRAVILTQNRPSANSKNDSKPRATNKPSANSENDSEPRATKKPRPIFGSRAIMPGTIQRPRDIDSTSNTKRIDPKRDL
jgi:hypothetical protein